MSNHLDPFSNPLNMQTIKEIDNLDLPIMQKHHLRILAHCLQILKIINIESSLEYQNKSPLREWCDNQSKKFDDVFIQSLFNFFSFNVCNETVFVRLLNYIFNRIFVNHDI